MSEELQSLLRSLRDVDGVLGSFVLGRQGGLDARDLPDYFDSAVLLEVAPRVERLYEAWKSLGSELETASLSFAEHKLHLREFGAGFLAVVSLTQVNAPALRMAMGMVGRRLGSALDAQANPYAPRPLLAGEPRPSAAQTQAAPDGRPTRPTRPAPEPDPSKARIYRGNVVR
jgi:predicted regulator of Ras-like GTPase activity (Roadblock/LC7/MglB family)